MRQAEKRAALARLPQPTIEHQRLGLERLSSTKKL
ncbi:hypothetical protein X741_22835 [Mesorhizobium sp. LNHC229A00]|nr:hypothetical protein X741_22835 [Mesorhizobium sp. LNHC229A00]